MCWWCRSYLMLEPSTLVQTELLQDSNSIWFDLLLKRKVIFDEVMSLKHPSDQLRRNCFSQLRNVSKLRTTATKDELEMIIHAFVRLSLVSRSFRRETNRRVYITSVLKSLQWPPVNSQINFKTLALIFRSIHGQVPPSFQPYNPSRSLRSFNEPVNGSSHSLQDLRSQILSRSRT